MRRNRDEYEEHPTGSSPWGRRDETRCVHPQLEARARGHPGTSLPPSPRTSCGTSSHGSASPESTARPRTRRSGVSSPSGSGAHRPGGWASRWTRRATWSWATPGGPRSSSAPITMRSPARRGPTTTPAAWPPCWPPPVPSAPRRASATSPSTARSAGSWAAGRWSAGWGGTARSRSMSWRWSATPAGKPGSQRNPVPLIQAPPVGDFLGVVGTHRSGPNPRSRPGHGGLPCRPGPGPVPAGRPAGEDRATFPSPGGDGAETVDSARLQLEDPLVPDRLQALIDGQALVDLPPLPGVPHVAARQHPEYLRLKIRHQEQHEGK